MLARPLVWSLAVVWLGLQNGSTVFMLIARGGAVRRRDRPQEHAAGANSHGVSGPGPVGGLA